MEPRLLYRKLYEGTGYQDVDELLKHIPFLPYEVRKKLMTVCRARHFPEPDTTLFSQCWKALQTLISGSYERKTTIKSILSSPMLSGFLLSALLSAPYSEQDVSSIRKQLMWKEVSVMESVPRSPNIDWMQLLQSLYPLHIDMKPSPNTNRRVRTALRTWIRKLQRSVLYPTMGNKSVSVDTRRRFEESLNRSIDSDIDVTSTMIEHYYSRTGIQLGGSCEMKQKWYPTQSSPRTYYAQGGQAYHSSKFLRDAINWLCDAFFPTNRYSRVSPSGIPVDQTSEDVWIYDLTSFTSLFHEHRSFLQFLAVLTDDVSVTIFDSWEGPITANLGQLIYQYLEVNVLQPSYMSKLPEFVDLELHHSVAGFLGVFGNLASCTFPHGICLSTVKDNPDECWCAGDDAGTKEDIDDEGYYTWSTAQLLGSIAREKSFNASEPGAIALKRPMSIHAGLLYSHANILWPIFAIMSDKDPRFYDPIAKSPVEKISGAIVSFLRSCQRVPLSPSDIEFAYRFFGQFYQRFKLPTSGWYPPLTGFHPWNTTIPRMDRSIFGKDPLHVLVNAFYGTEYVAGVLEDSVWDKRLPPLHETFTCNSEQHLTYLVKLGYLSRDMISCVYPGIEGLERARLDIDKPRNLNVLYEYTVIEDIPDSLQPLVHKDEY